MVETVEMLTLDAIEYAPTLWVVLTAREHLTRLTCRDHLRQLRKALRRRWPGSSGSCRSSSSGAARSISTC